MLVVTIKGRNPELKSILLNGHYDVVPAERDKWNYDPFAGTIDPQSGNIYARGSQDMKNVCMQYGKLLLGYENFVCFEFMLVSV